MSVHVANFSLIEDAEIDCDYLVVLIAQLLASGDAFYDVSAPITAEDFFGRDTMKPIEIRVTFGKLTHAFASCVRVTKQRAQATAEDRIGTRPSLKNKTELIRLPEARVSECRIFLGACLLQ